MSVHRKLKSNTVRSVGGGLRAAFLVAAFVVVPLTVFSAPSPDDKDKTPIAKVTGSLSLTQSGSLTITNTPPSAPAATPSPFLHFISPTLFVIAMTTDPTTSARIEVTVARHLQQAVATGSPLQVTTAPNWALADFLSECSVDNLGATAGALLIFNGSLQQGSESYFLLARGFSRIDADAMLIECNQQQANVLWLAHDVNGFANRNTVTPLPADALAGSILAAIAQHSKSTATTYGGGSTMTATTSGMTTITTTTNQPSTTTTTGSNQETFNGGVVAVSSLGALASTSNPVEYSYPGLNNDVVNRIAAERLAKNLIVDDLKGHGAGTGFTCPAGPPVHLCTNWFDFNKISATGGWSVK